MQIFHQKVAYIFFLLALTCQAAFASGPSIPPFRAAYQLSHNGVEIGHVDLTVEAITSEQYKLSSKTESSGLLSFLRDDDVVETSLFEMTNTLIRPITYQYSEQLGNGTKNIQLAFDWQKLSVSNTSKGESWQMKIHLGVIDKALMQIALMHDLKQLKKNLNYQVADGGRLKTYAFTYQGEELININNKPYQTVRLARKKDNKSQITTYWCAKSLHMLPVLLTREKKYGTFKMELISASFED